MSVLPSTGAAVVYSLLLLVFVAYGTNALYLAWIACRRGAPDPPAPRLADLPFVTVQIAIFNELYVARRVIDAVARLDWPAERLEIHVLDDSTDETREIVQASAERWEAQGVRMRVIHRATREGFKAGALAAGMKTARGKFLAYFDADFVPPRDFLKRTVPYFADPKVAFVQTRWGYLNRGYSLLTRLQALLLDAHFMLEQVGRNRGGFFFNFNGTAGVWRRDAIVSAGGWTFDTVTEDVDLSYRAYLNGWRAIYLRDLVSPAELPVTVSGFRRQQHRWACGGFECALKLLPQVWRAPIELAKKVQATMHLTGYVVHLALFALLVAYPVLLPLAQRAPIAFKAYSWVLGAVLFLAPITFFTLAQQQQGGAWWRRFPAILLLSVLGCGMVPMTLRAAWNVARGRDRIFERTPKFAITRRDDTWANRRYQLPFDPLTYLEGLVALWSFTVILHSLATDRWILAVFPAFILAGTLYVLGLNLMQSAQSSATRSLAGTPDSSRAGEHP